MAVAELANITAALVLAREGQEAERGRFDREAKRAAALGEELVASEARRKVQEEEISLVRKQVRAPTVVFLLRLFCLKIPRFACAFLKRCVHHHDRWINLTSFLFYFILFLFTSGHDVSLNWMYVPVCTHTHTHTLRAFPPFLAPPIYIHTQVSRLDSKIEGDMSREKAKSEATVRASVAGAEREANLLRASLRETEAELLASRERERLAADAAGASLKAELVVARDTADRAERALATALERARSAEAGAGAKDRQAERAAQAARQDKDTLKRGLVASQTACAELRAERSRLLSELEQAASSAAVAAATAAAAAATAAPPMGSDSCFSSPTGGIGVGIGGSVGTTGLGVGAGASTAAAVASAAAHTDLEGRLALALAESAEARAEAQRLKNKVRAYDRQRHKIAVGAAAGPASQAQGVVGGDDGLFLGEGRWGRRERLQEGLRESCRVMDRVATALSAAVDAGTDGLRSGGGGNELDVDRRLAAGERKRRSRGGSAGGVVVGGRQHSLAPAPATHQKGSGRRRGSRRRRAFSMDSRHSGSGDDDGDRDRHPHDDVDSFGDTSEGGSPVDDDAQRVVSRAEVREFSARLRFEAARLLGVREDERKAAEGKVARLRQDLRDSEGREAEITARLEESREVSWGIRVRTGSPLCA